MARTYKEQKVPTTEETHTPGKHPPYCLPAIPLEIRLKWGLSLLGEEKAFEYLQWLREKIKGCNQ